MQETKPLNWLQRLKDESWEAELLISAISIFAILSAFTPLNWFVNFLIDHLPPEQYPFGYIIGFTSYLALGILGAFFIIHLGLRAYWIGLVGLNSVFPDYSLEDSAYSELYTQKMLDTLPKLPSTISALDEICSVVFSAAFSILLIYANASVIFGLLLWVYNLADGTFIQAALPYALIPFVLVLVAGNILSIVANIKRYKNNDRVQIWYYHSALWSNKLLLGPLYIYLMQITMVFGTNFKRKKSIVVAILIMSTFGIAFAVFQALQSNIMYLSKTESYHDKSRIYPSHYRTNNESQSFLLLPEIQSEIVSEPVVNLYVPVFDNETSEMKEACELTTPLTKSDKENTQERWQWNRDCYASKVRVLVDDVEVKTEFSKSEHPKTKQFGLFTFVDLSAFAPGQHKISVIKDVPKGEERISYISFYLVEE